MKALRYTLLLGFCLVLLSPRVHAKNKARLSVEYQKETGADASLFIHVKFKGENGYEPAANLTLYVYEEIDEDSLALNGEVVTDAEGHARFVLKKFTSDDDEWVKHQFVVKIENDKQFKDAAKKIGFKEVNLTAKAVVKDGVNYISATLTDINGNPLEGEKLQVVVQRLFAPLTIGKSSYKTDDDGNILVEVSRPLPGIDGILTFEVILDSRKYGNVKSVFDASIGELITDRSTFDKRTMWSPPNKTPLFLWIFPNIVILGIWIVIFILVRNLFRIYKSNKQTKKS